MDVRLVVNQITTSVFGILNRYHGFLSGYTINPSKSTLPLYCLWYLYEKRSEKRGLKACA